MLMTVLRGELAVKQSKALIRMFKQMKDFIIENQDFIGSKELVQIAIQTNQNTNDIAEIKSQMATKEDLKKVMDNFIDPDTYKHFLLMNGDKIEADVAYTKIYKSAKKSIYVIDNYIGLKTLELLRAAKDSVEVIIFSDNVRNKDMLTKNILNDFIRDYPNINLKMKIADKKYHDRYIAIDYGMENEAFYLCGASSKDAGNKISSITKIEESSKDMYHTMFGGMLNNKNLKIQYLNNRLDSYMSFKQGGRSIIYRLFNYNKQEEHYMEEKRNEQRQQRKLERSFMRLLSNSMITQLKQYKIN